MGAEHSGGESGGDRSQPSSASGAEGHRRCNSSSDATGELTRPNLRRAATMGPSTAHITISPPPPVRGMHLFHTRGDSVSSDSSSTSDHLPPFKLARAKPGHLEVPAPQPTKRNQFLTIDFLPNNNSASPQSHPSSAPSSALSPLSALSSSAGSTTSSIFGSSASSLSIPPSRYPSGGSSVGSSTSSSPRISAALRDHVLALRSSKSPLSSPSSSAFPHSPPPLSPNLSSSLSSSMSSLFEPKQPTVETQTVHTCYNAAGQKQINQYVIEGVDIGRGSYGTVKLVFNVQDSRYYAMKIMSKSLLKKRRIPGFSAGLARTASLGGVNSSPTVTVRSGTFMQSPTPSPSASPLRTVSSGLLSGPPDHWANVQREVAIHKKLRHENIVRLYEVMDDPSTDNLYLITEYMSHGAIMSGEIDQLHALPIDRCWAYFRDVVYGLEYLHFLSILHRDIKPMNLLLSATGRVAISDFGVSMLFEGNDDRILSGSTTVGSAAFMAPELCGGGLASGGASIPSSPQPSSAGRPSPLLLEAIAAHQRQNSGSLNLERSFSLPVGLSPARPSLLRVGSENSPFEVSGKKGDIWSLGATLFVMLFGSLPFIAKTVPLLYRAIVEDELQFPASGDLQANPNGIGPETHADLIDLLHRMLDKNPLTRISIHDIKTHPWVTRNGTVPMEDQCDYGGGTTPQNQHQKPARKLSFSAQRRAARAEKAEARAARKTHSRGGSGLESTAEAADAELTDTDTDEIEEEEEQPEETPTRLPSKSTSSYQQISLTSEDMLGAVTLVSRVILVVKLKAKMRRARMQLASMRARSNSVGSTPPTGLAPLFRQRRPKSRSPTQAQVQAAATECLSPSMSLTEHISVAPKDLEQVHAQSLGAPGSSKRRALVGSSSQALLNAARGAISAGTSGDRAAAEWVDERVNQRAESDDFPLQSHLARPPVSPLGLSMQRTPQFLRRKGSCTQLEESDSSSPMPPPQEAIGVRHQSAPLRPAPFYYVPYDTYVQQAHSYSCSQLSPEVQAAVDGGRIRSALDVQQQLVDQQHQQHQQSQPQQQTQHDADIDSDSSDFADEEVATFADDDLDI